METKELYFEASVVWKEKTTGIIVAPSADDPIEVATPVEFLDGEEGKWSPESLFLGAISSCYMTTFLSFAKRKNLAFIKFKCHSAGTIDIEDGKPMFTQVTLFPEVHLMEAEQEALAEEILKLTEKYCLVGNSVKSRINVRSMVTAEEELVLN